MAKIDVETTLNTYHPGYWELKGKEPVEKTKVGWVGIDPDTGVKTEVKISGPAKQVDALLNTFPLGKAGKNIAVDVSLSCSQRTITSALAAAVEADKEQSSDPNAEPTPQASPLTAIDKALDKELQAATQ